MKPTHFKLTFQSNYNGMSMSVDWDKCPNADEITPEQEDVLERIAETLPEKTHKWDA